MIKKAAFPRITRAGHSPAPGGPLPPRDQGAARHRQQPDPERGAARRAAPAVDVAAERQGRSAGQGQGTARAGPRLRADRRRTGRVEEYGLSSGSGHAPPGPAELRGVPQAVAEGVRQVLGRRAAHSAKLSGEPSPWPRQPRSAPLSDREILIAGAIAYWCEGVKNKPYRRHDRVELHQQRSGDDQVLPAVPRRGWASRHDQLIFRVLHPRERRRRCGAAILARRHRGSTSPVPATRHSSGTTRGPSGRTPATTTTAACASMSGASADLYRKIEGWAAARHGHAEPNDPDRSPVIRFEPVIWLPREDSNLG